MELKIYEGKILFYIIDHTPNTVSHNNLSIKKTKTEHTANAIMKYWVAVYGLVGKFPTVNGGEIVKNDLLKILTQTIPKQTFFNYCCCHKNELEHRHIFLHLD